MTAGTASLYGFWNPRAETHTRFSMNWRLLPSRQHSQSLPWAVPAHKGQFPKGLASWTAGTGRYEAGG